MAEWLNAPVLKTGILKGIWGSNPCSSAKLLSGEIGYFNYNLANTPSRLEGGD